MKKAWDPGRGGLISTHSGHQKLAEPVFCRHNASRIGFRANQPTIE
jgi:hypothetical protein